MNSSPPPVRRTAWLYTRGDEAVRLELQEGVGTPRLLVYGPGTAYVAFDFPDENAMSEYQATYEGGLLEKGFQLQASADRRGRTDRRGEPRSRQDRRRS